MFLFLQLSKKLLIGLFFIPLLSYGQEFVSVCDRTPQVRKVIMRNIGYIDSSIRCWDDDLIKLILPEIGGLKLLREGITSFKGR